MYTLLLLLIYMAFISLGLPDSLLGSAWPIMHEAFSVPLSYAGLVTMIISAGTICSSLMSERLTKKFGTQIVTVCSVLLTAAALFGFSTSSAFYMLCLWAIPYGLGAGAIDVALNNYVALHYSSKHMSWLHCFWGVGTIISPYIMSYALTTSSWQNGYRMVSFLQMGITMILFVTLPVWKVNKTAEQQEEQHEVIGIRGAVKIKGVPQLLLGFFSYCALESTLILWSSSYLVGAKGISAERAAAYAALFCSGITLGRFLAGFVTEKLGDHKMIRLGTTILLAGCAAVLLPIPSDTAALAGLVVMDWMCTGLPIDHSRNTGKFWREKFPGNHRYPDGECLCRLYIYAAGFWTDRKSYFHHTAAGLCADFHCVNVFHGGKDIPAGAVIEKKTKNEGRLFHKP